MKKYIFYSISLLLLTNCIDSVERNCLDFKTGVFTSNITINNTIYSSKFSRSETLQIEHYNGKTDSSYVRWINDCEVVFKTINPKSMAEQKDVHLKILNTTHNSYTFEYSYVGETKKQKGVAFKIK